MIKNRKLNEVEMLLVSEKCGGLNCSCANPRHKEIVETQTGHIMCNTCKKMLVRNFDYKELIKKKRLELSIQGYTNINVYDQTRLEVIGLQG